MFSAAQRSLYTAGCPIAARQSRRAELLPILRRRRLASCPHKSPPTSYIHAYIWTRAQVTCEGELSTFSTVPLAVSDGCSRQLDPTFTPPRILSARIAQSPSVDTPRRIEFTLFFNLDVLPQRFVHASPDRCCDRLFLLNTFDVECAPNARRIKGACGVDLPNIKPALPPEPWSSDEGLRPRRCESRDGICTSLGCIRKGSHLTVYSRHLPASVGYRKATFCLQYMPRQALWDADLAPILTRAACGTTGTSRPMCYSRPRSPLVKCHIVPRFWSCGILAHLDSPAYCFQPPPSILFFARLLHASFLSRRYIHACLLLDSGHPKPNLYMTQ